MSASASETASFVGQQSSSSGSQPPLFTGFQQLPPQQGEAHFPHVAALPQQVPSSQKVTPSPPRQEAAAVPVQTSPGPSITPPSQMTIQHGTPAPSQRPVTSSVSPEELRPQGLQMYYTPGQHTPTDSQAPPISYRTPGLSPPQYTVPPSTPVAPSRLPEPIVPHWFYFKEGRKWTPFSHIDSESLELASKTPSSGESRIVPTDGGRYDVDLDKRLRHAIYWEESVSVVRRCSWFCKGSGESKLTPYTEDLAVRLEVCIVF